MAKNWTRWAGGQAGSARCDAARVSGCPLCPVHCPGTETACAPAPSYTTTMSQKSTVTRSPAGGAAGRVTITEHADAAPALSPGSAVGILSAGMAQKLGEWAKAPTEATGLYRAVLLRSGKWGPCHHWGHSWQNGSSFLPWRPGFFLPIISKLRHFFITPCSALPFLFSPLPSIALFLSLETHALA